MTISGGEGMMQPEFLLELTNKLKDHNIHLAIETTGYINSDIFKSLSRQFDLLLFDVKHYDRDEHYKGTGVKNDLILKNLEWSLKQDFNILCRIPVIPGFNNSLEDASGFVQLFKEMNIKRVQLLPFHQFGEKKYERLRMDYQYKDIKNLHPEELRDYQKVFLDAGIDCFF